MYYDLINTGYYDNAADTYDTYEEVNPVIETTLPYVDGTGTLPVCYLRPDSAFVSASDEYIEQTRLIGKTTDINSFPDSNYIDLGFHYPNWHFSNAGSSALYADFDNNYKVDFNDLSEFANYWLYDYNYNYQCWWWDWFENGLIDFNDLDVIMEHWLNPYDFTDFADFAKYWQRQVDYRFENRRFDLVTDNIVDFRDFSKFAEQWGQETTSVDPNIQIHISGDSNNGDVDVGVSGWTTETRRIFLLANGVFVQEIFRFKDGEALTIDISELGDVEQQLKVVSVDSNSHLTCSNIINVVLPKQLYFCVLPDIYERNQPLPFAAYNPGTEDASVNVYANGGNLVWSQNFSGNTILGFIPAEITNQYVFDYVSFDINNEELLDGGGGASIEVFTDPYDPSQPPFLIQALIVVPDFGIIRRDYKTIGQVQAAFQAKGIGYAKLTLGRATYDKVASYVQNRNIRYLYINAHGNRWLDQDDGFFRTVVYLKDSTVVSIKRSDYLDPNNAPPWCVELLGDDEDTTKSFAMIGFNNLEFAYFDCCYSGRLKINENEELVEGVRGEVYDFDAPQSDMSFAIGMGEPSRSRFYQGWHDEYQIRMPPFETEHQKWTQLEWQHLKEGENLYWALYYTIQAQTEFGPLDPVNNYVLRGQGSWMDIELRSW